MTALSLSLSFLFLATPPHFRACFLANNVRTLRGYLRKLVFIRLWSSEYGKNNMKKNS